MTDINVLTIVGRLTKDAELGYIGNGTARANVSIACNRSKKQGDSWVDETSFFDVTVWGKTAENLQPYLTKGKQILIKGFIKQDRWEKDGQKFNRVGIVAEEVQLMGGKTSEGETQGGGFTPKANGSSPQANDNGFSEDIPF